MWHSDDQESQSTLPPRLGHNGNCSPEQELHQSHQQKEGVLRASDNRVNPHRDLFLLNVSVLFFTLESFLPMQVFDAGNV